MVEKGAKDSAAFTKKLKLENKELKRRERTLLGYPKEVKRLSDLLLLELKVTFLLSFYIKEKL